MTESGLYLFFTLGWYNIYSIFSVTEVNMDTLENLKGRRAINFFDPDKKIPDEKLKELLNIANLSPSSSNLQPWGIIVVTDPDKKKLLRECAFNQPKVEEASAVFIIIADPGALEENINKVLHRAAELGYITEDAIEKQRQGPFNMYGEKFSLKRKMFAVKNAALFGMSIMFAARGMGYETHPMDGFNEDKIKEKFNIGEDKIIPMLIAIGYLKPNVTLLPRAYRRPLDDFVKFNP